MRVQAPVRVSRSYNQQLCAPPEKVFELLCPVRETEWVNDWNPTVVFSQSGVAEPDCVFVTPGVPDDSLWVIIDHDPVAHHLEILKLIPGIAVGRISISLAAQNDGGSSADITYAYTSLGDYGDRTLAEFTEAHFNSFMEVWERELNHFLQTGTKLEGHGS